MIRAARKEDFPAVKELMNGLHGAHAEARPDVYKKDLVFQMENYEQMLGDSAARIFVYEAERVFGLMMLKIKETQESEAQVGRRFCHIEAIVVDPGLRKAGVGRKLLEYANEMSRELGLDAIELMVWDFNEDARRFYEKDGMTTKYTVLEKKLR